MAEPKSTLPDFNEPPVIETVLGVQFGALKGFSIPHYGLYWAKIRSDYPRFEIQPPLNPIIEQFGAAVKLGPQISFGFSPVPEIRHWFVDPSGTRLIQIQRDRFIHNWQKIKGDEVYPRYDTLRPKFEEEWKRFCEFLHEENLERPEVNQCEVIYVNHIEPGKGWKSYGEINKVIAGWSGRYSGAFLPEAERLGLNTTYIMPGNKGRLYITMQPAIRRRDAKEVLQLELTARGRPDSSRLEDILDWFDLGHEWIVRGFTDFTAKEMHKVWRRKL